jgi:hypothetical protein
VQDLNADVQGCVAEVIVTLHAVGISDSENRQTKRVLLRRPHFVRRYMMEYLDM